MAAVNRFSQAEAVAGGPRRPAGQVRAVGKRKPKAVGVVAADWKWRDDCLPLPRSFVLKTVSRLTPFCTRHTGQTKSLRNPLSIAHLWAKIVELWPFWRRGKILRNLQFVCIFRIRWRYNFFCHLSLIYRADDHSICVCRLATTSNTITRSVF